MKFIILIVFIFSFHVYAESNYIVDTKSSFALFKILKKNYPSPSYGRFPFVEGEFQLGKNGEIKSCEFKIKTEFVSSGRLKQNSFIRGKELFFVEQYPEIKIACKKFIKKSTTEYSGELKLKLKSKEIIVGKVIARKISDRMGSDWLSKVRQGLDFRFVVNRKTFGMNRHNVYRHGKRLEFVVSVEGLRESEKKIELSK